MKYLFNLKKDILDVRDKAYSKRLVGLPQKISLISECSKIEDQGQIGSCTANALVGNLEYLENRDKTKFIDLSRLFVYYNERFVEGHTFEDSGASLRDGIKVLKNFGVCSESLWPYEGVKLFEKPTDIAYQEAKKHTIKTYERLKNLTEMKDCLASGYPFVFGIKVFTSIQSEVVSKTGKIPLPSESDEFIGGHALLAVGFDDRDQTLTIRNSWGTSWGADGYGTLSYEYLSKDLAMDIWTIKR